MRAPKPLNANSVQQGMLLLGAYFGAYIGIGFVSTHWQLEKMYWKPPAGGTTSQKPRRQQRTLFTNVTPKKHLLHLQNLQKKSGGGGSTSPSVMMSIDDTITADIIFLHPITQRQQGCISTTRSQKLSRIEHGASTNQKLQVQQLKAIMQAFTKAMELMEQMDEELVRLRRENSELKVLGHQRTRQQGIDALHASSLDLLYDQDFALSFVRNNSVGWNDLPKQWQDDPKVICAIFESKRAEPVKKPNEFRCGSNDVDEWKYLSWSDLPYSMKMNKEVISHALRVERGLRWDDVPVQFRQNDVDLLVTAVLYDKISSYTEDVPQYLQMHNKEVAFYGAQRNHIEVDGCPCLKDDREFWRQVMEEGRADWDKLPSGLKTDVNFARSISSCEDKRLPKQMLEYLVELHHDQPFWRQIMTLLKSDPTGDCEGQVKRDWARQFERLMEYFAPYELLADYAFMLEMCQKCAPVFAVVEEGLAGNRSFLEEVLATKSEVLRYFSPETQQLHRDLVIKTIPHLTETMSGSSLEIYYIAQSLDASFWSDHDFAMMWVKAGLGFQTHLFERETRYAWENDRDLALASIVYGKTFHNWVPMTFREDIPFMLEVVQHHPTFYFEAYGAAKSDLSVLTTALAGSKSLAERVIVSDLHLKGHDEKIREIILFLWRSLQPFQTFSSCILGNMLSAQSVHGTGTNLTLLNQGPETCHMYKKLLAEYVGIPTGKRLACLQNAQRNVIEAMAPFLEEIFECWKAEV